MTRWVRLLTESAAQGCFVVSSGLDIQADGLLERAGELGLLEADLSGARAGKGRLVLISGPAGVGKTALVRSVRRQGEATGMMVLRARGVELEQGFAFGVVRQLLERVVLGSEPVERARLLAGPARVAGALLDGADPPPVGSEHRSFALLHGVYALAVNLAERDPIVIVVDDAHWADAPSLRWLGYMSGRLDGLGVLAVVAVRGGDRSGDDPVFDAIGAEAGTRRLTLAPLSPAASSVLVAREFGAAAAPQFCDACYSATGGNPFFLGELFQALQAARVAPTPEGASRRAGTGDSGPVDIGAHRGAVFGRGGPGPRRGGAWN